MDQQTLDLPKPIAAYFAAEQGDSELLSRCFTAEAVVTDEARTYHGRAEIVKWKTEAAKKYQYTSVPFACQPDGGKIVVTSRLTGNFPGSPIDLRYFFTLAGDQIATLEIIP